MARPLPIEALVNRERVLIAAALAAIATLAWVYMVREARAMANTGVCQCLGLKMSGPDLEPWSAALMLPLFLMWAVMMVGMMVPSAAPMILTFAAVNRRRREQHKPFVPTAIFAGGYLAVWTLFSLVAAIAQWILHGTALLSSNMVATSPMLSGFTLIGAGLFQWTPLKNACLTHCRSPLSFLMTDWREGKGGAFAMGIKHGAYCTGCCWLLMLMLFVCGVMNMWWVGLLSVLVLLEKVAPRGLFIGRVSGVAIGLWGVWLLVKAF